MKEKNNYTTTWYNEVVPECRKHKKTRCMKQYYIGDGVNIPLNSVWLCRYAVASLRKHGLREALIDVSITIPTQER